MKTRQTSEYFGVCRVKSPQYRANGKEWQAKVMNYTTGSQAFKYFADEKEAAKWVDWQLAKQGKEPVNVLKRV